VINNKALTLFEIKIKNNYVIFSLLHKKTLLSKTEEIKVKIIYPVRVSLGKSPSLSAQAHWAILDSIYIGRFSNGYGGKTPLILLKSQ